jgi:hypothetical protein
MRIGQVVGLFTPQGVVEEERLKSLFNHEEAERILATQGHAGRSLQEIWRDVSSK